MKALKREVSRINLKDGEFYAQSYDQRKELGRGKFGVVYHVKDKKTDRCYAAKHIRIRKLEQKDKVVEEINLLKKFSNPHIIRFIEAFENPGEVILIMEYLDGGELFERVADDDFNLTESDCCLFMRQICRGVQYLHDHNIVHLDLKPENVVCTQKDNTTVKIIDFGTAKELEPGEGVKVLCGTPEFVAPEVVRYDFISTGSDMWALGVICYILLSGFSPFMGDNDQETYNNISSCTYDYECEEFDVISDNAKDFINCLLKEKPKLRMTAQQCLSHGWLLEQDIGSSVIKTENLRKFLARRRWQRCGQAIRAMSRMSGLMKRRGSNSSAESLDSRDHSPVPSPLASPQVARKNKENTDTKDNSPVPSPLASPATSRRNKEMEVTGEGGVRARLNLLEERLRGEFGGSRVVRSQIKEPVKEKVATTPEKKADEVAVKKVEEVSKSAEVAVKLERGEEGKHVR